MSLCGLPSVTVSDSVHGGPCKPVQIIGWHAVLLPCWSADSTAHSTSLNLARSSHRDSFSVWYCWVTSRNTWLACSYLPFSDGRGTMQLCRVQSEGVKNEFKGLQETGLPATGLLQWSLYFKTPHGTKKMWSYIAGGLKIRVF